MESYETEEILEQRKIKQEYLKSEILAKNYDGAQFAEYLNSLKEDGGSNIDMWSVPELKAHVQEFKKIMDAYYAANGGHQEGQQGGEQGEAQSPELQQDREANYVHTNDDLGQLDSNKEEIYSHIVDVKTCEHSALNDHKDVHIIIGEPELVKGGLFSPSFIQYKVTTMPMGWVVKRRFSDFFWLRGVLQKLYLGYIIPPVPQKKNKGKFENDFIRKRMNFLERFLNSCAKNEEFKANKFFYFFLSMADDKQFKLKTKDGESARKVTRLDEITNLKGQIPLEINTNLKYYAAHAGELLNQTDGLYKKIRKMSKQLTADLDQASNTIFNIGECYAALYAVTNNFNKNVAVGKNPYLDDIYLTLNNMMVSWGEQMLGQIKIVQKNMVSFYKYADYENESFRELIQARAKAGLDYVTKKRELIAKKEKLFMQGDTTRWELTANATKEYTREQLVKNKAIAYEVMLPRETMLVRESRDLFAYQNALAYAEIDKALHEKCKEYSNNFHELAKTQAENLTDVHVHWADLMAHFTESKLKSGAGGLKDRASIQHRVQNKDEAGLSGHFADD